MLFFLILLLTGVAGHHAAILITAYLASSYSLFEDFVGGLLNLVYAGSAMVIIFHLFFGEAAILLIAFAGSMFITMARIDLEATHELMSE